MYTSSEILPTYKTSFRTGVTGRCSAMTYCGGCRIHNSNDVRRSGELSGSRVTSGTVYVCSIPHAVLHMSSSEKLINLLSFAPSSSEVPRRVLSLPIWCRSHDEREDVPRPSPIVVGQGKSRAGIRRTVPGRHPA